MIYTISSGFDIHNKLYITYTHTQGCLREPVHTRPRVRRGWQHGAGGACHSGVYTSHLL